MQSGQPTTTTGSVFSFGTTPAPATGGGFSFPSLSSGGTNIFGQAAGATTTTASSTATTTTGGLFGSTAGGGGFTFGAGASQGATGFGSFGKGTGFQLGQQPKPATTTPAPVFGSIAPVTTTAAATAPFSSVGLPAMFQTAVTTASSSGGITFGTGSSIGGFGTGAGTGFQIGQQSKSATTTSAPICGSITPIMTTTPAAVPFSSGGIPGMFQTAVATTTTASGGITFGTGTSGGIFGKSTGFQIGQQSKPTATTTAAPASIFGSIAPTTTTPAMIPVSNVGLPAMFQTPVTTTPASGGITFGAGTSIAGFGLGSGFQIGQQSKPATTTAAPAPLFGSIVPTASTTTAAPAPIFGSVVPAAATTAAPAPFSSVGLTGIQQPAISTTTASGGISFGTGIFGKDSGFQLGQQSKAATTTAAPAPVFGSIAPTASTTTSALAPVFGSVAASATTTAPAPAPFSNVGLSGIFQTPATTMTASGGTVAAPVFGSVAATPVTTAAAPAPVFSSIAAAATTTTTTAPITSVGVAGIRQTAVAATTTTTAGGVTFGAGTSVGGVGEAKTTTDTASKPITYQQLEELINRWTMDLEDQERVFFSQATQVNMWDRMLMENGEKILKLNNDVGNLEQEQRRVDYELDFVAQQQNELTQIVEQLEKSLALDGEIGGGYGQVSDARREEMVQLQATIDCQLKQVGRDVAQVIERINSASDAGTDVDPFKQIAAVLSKQMDSLQWLDERIVGLEHRSQLLQADVQKRRVDSHGQI